MPARVTCSWVISDKGQRRSEEVYRFVASAISVRVQVVERSFVCAPYLFEPCFASPNESDAAHITRHTTVTTERRAARRLARCWQPALCVSVGCLLCAGFGVVLCQAAVVRTVQMALWQ